MLFHPHGCTKSSKFERVMIVQTHGDDEKKGGFFLFLQKVGPVGAQFFANDQLT